MLSKNIYNYNEQLATDVHKNIEYRNTNNIIIIKKL